MFRDVLLLAAVAAVVGWSTGAAPGTGEASKEPLQAATVAAAVRDSAAALHAGAQLLASEPPAAIVAGSPQGEARSVDRLPVMHRMSGVQGGEEQQGHLSAFVSLVAEASTTVQASQYWVSVPLYWQALLMVFGAVFVFVGCLGCSYCLCIGYSEREAKKRITRRMKMGGR